MTKTLLLAACAAIIAGERLGPVEAAPVSFADHLQCHKIKDTAKGKYTADLASNTIGFEPGCVIKLPAKLLCLGVAKSNVSPTPFPAPAGTNLNGSFYLCYKVKCPGKNETQLPLSDQLGGSRQISVKPPDMLCTPAG